MNRECAATGFFVNGEGYILTNAHVVEDAQRCLAGSPQAKIMAKLAEPGAHAATAVSCDVVGIDNVHDLALLKTERPSPAASPYPYAWLDPRPVRPGARIVVIGYPTFRWEPRQEEAKVVRVSAMNLWGEEDIASESGRRAQVVVFDAPLEMGSSGSPVCLEAGVVVGVVARRDVRNRAHSVAVSISHAIDLLNRHGVRWHGAAD